VSRTFPFRSRATRRCIRLNAWLMSLGLGCSPDPTAGTADEDKDGLESGDTVDSSTAPGDEAGAVDPASRCSESRIGPPMLRRLNRTEYTNTLEGLFDGLAGKWSGGRMGPDPVSDLGFDNDAAILVVSDQVAKEILATAEEVADVVTSQGMLETVVPECTDLSDACATKFVGQLGQRLFRRPLTGDETARYLALFDSVTGDSDFGTGLKWTLVALLESPYVVYRSELGESSNGRFRLRPHEIATALAYGFSGEPPSSELLERAERGELESATARIEEARRLLATQSGIDVVRSFFRQWIDYHEVEDRLRDIPQFDEVRDDMVNETRRFIDKVIHDEQGDVRDLLLADYTLLNGALSEYYGFGGVEGVRFAMVSRPSEWGVGLLAQGSFLATRAHEGYSSPTQRGLTIREQLLCQPRSAPPPDVPPLEFDVLEATTTRERYELAHASNPYCAGCHRQFDPVGFAFEHFDQGGRYRATENDHAIDAHGSLRIGDQVLEFDGVTDLATQLAASPDVTDCVSGRLTLYTFGGASSEICAAEDARAELQAGAIGIAEFLARLAGSEHFIFRDED